MLKISHLRFAYDETVLFDELSLTVAPGSITALVGANGAGKSTLMNCITGVLRPLAGEIMLDGLSLAQDVNAVRRRIGYLPDNYGLFAALTVRQHLEYAAAAHQLPDPPGAVAEVVARTDLSQLLERPPAAMSRGQRQRLAIAMTLVHKPRFILLDEPASGLDPSARMALSQLLLSLRDEGATLLVSSHILTELRDYATDCIIMDGGRIIHSGSLTENDRWRITLAGDEQEVGRQAAMEYLAQSKAENPDCSGRYIYFDLPPGADSSRLLADLVAAKVAVGEFTCIGTDIEQIYSQVSRQASEPHAVA